MLITSVDAALEQLVRRRLPLPESTGDVSFDAPDKSWGARLSRIAVNLFLFDVGRSSQPGTPPQLRQGPDGRLERRPPLPQVKLCYLVTAWAGSMRDEHQLLGDVLATFLTNQTLSPDYFDEPMPATVQLAIAQREGRKPGDVQSGLDGKLKPSIELEVTLALDANWEPAPTQVSGVESRTPAPSAGFPRRDPGPELPRMRRTRQGETIISEKVEPEKLES